MGRTGRDGLVEEEVSEDGVDRLAVGRVGNVLAEGRVGLRDDEVVTVGNEFEDKGVRQRGFEDERVGKERGGQVRTSKAQTRAGRRECLLREVRCTQVSFEPADEGRPRG